MSYSKHRADPRLPPGCDPLRLSLEAGEATQQASICSRPTTMAVECAYYALTTHGRVDAFVMRTETACRMTSRPQLDAERNRGSATA